ncbi:STAS domain-containing protein [Baekduia sp. Peel2402]|uniref:STAS domain-containing protein n=1 Tax=Baekduia sp. Peel2402 TaxID=3458296 RepID=UPI00403E84F8
MSRPFEIRTDTTAQHIGLLILVGPLGAEGARELVTTTEAVLPNTHVLILDLSGLTTCDPAGVQAVIEIDALARNANVLLVIRPANDAVHRAFVETGAADRLRIVGGGGEVPGAQEQH